MGAYSGVIFLDQSGFDDVRMPGNLQIIYNHLLQVTLLNTLCSIASHVVGLQWFVAVIEFALVEICALLALWILWHKPPSSIDKKPAV